MSCLAEIFHENSTEKFYGTAEAITSLPKRFHKGEGLDFLNTLVFCVAFLGVVFQM